MVLHLHLSTSPGSSTPVQKQTNQGSREGMSLAKATQLRGGVGSEPSCT